MGWQNTALVLHSSKEERKMLCPKPGCGLGAAGRAGACCWYGCRLWLRGRSREIMGRDHSQQREAQLCTVDLSSQGKHEVQWDAHRTVSPAGLCECSYQHISQFTSEFKTAALQQRTTACKRTHRSPGWDMHWIPVRRIIFISLFNSRFLCSLCWCWCRFIPVPKLSHREKGNNTVWLHSLGI